MVCPPAVATSSARFACPVFHTRLAVGGRSVSCSQYLGCGTMSPRRIFVHRARDNPVAACICRRVISGDRKSTRLNSSHSQISYAVFCLKKKKKKIDIIEYSKNN